MLSLEDEITEEDLKDFLRGVQQATGTVITRTRNKALQITLAMWVCKPLKEILDRLEEPEYINIGKLFENKRVYRYLQGDDNTW